MTTRITMVALSALALGACGGGSNDSTTKTADTTERSTPKTTETVTARAKTTPADTTPKVDPAKRQVEQAVDELVEAAELGDGVRACLVLGDGTGTDLSQCAKGAGVNLAILPSSDELSIGSIKVSGASARAVLRGRGTLSLSRKGGRWRVIGLRPE